VDRPKTEEITSDFAFQAKAEHPQVTLVWYCSLESLTLATLLQYNLHIQLGNNLLRVFVFSIIFIKCGMTLI